MRCGFRRALRRPHEPGLQGPGGRGSLAPMTHRFPVRVYYEDTDVSGVVYHANYLKYMERAREHLLGVEAILLGFGLPDDNLHAPNESFDLAMLDKGIEVSKAILQNVASGFSPRLRSRPPAYIFTRPASNLRVNRATIPG